MNKTIRTTFMAAMAVAVSAPAVRVMAQYRVGSDGQALDANNRRDSGGVNYDDNRRQVTGNEIITGNVTAGREFRGPVGYTDPEAFRGTKAGKATDRFISDSAPSPVGGLSPRPMYAPAIPFYGNSRAAPAPEGFSQQPVTGAYVPVRPITPNPADLRMDASLSALQEETPRSGELVLPGPVDTTGQNTLITASPLYGVKQTVAGQGEGVWAIPSVERSLSLMRLQQELQAPQEVTPVAETAPVGLTDQALPAKSYSTTIRPESFSDQIPTNQGFSQRMLLTPSQQSSQYAEMKRRLEEAGGGKEKPGYREEKKNVTKEPGKLPSEPSGLTAPMIPPGKEQTRAEQLGVPDYGKQAEAQLGKKKIKAQPPASPMYVPGAATEPSDKVAPLKKQIPLQVKSLAEGVKVKGLADLLSKAEDLMRQGKYTSALDQYDLAERAASNNKLIVLGRAHAEMGAGYYARAEFDLMDALMSDPALLMGQYDLRRMLGDERLNYVVQDLKQIAANDPTQSRPLLLLAYIAYNTGNERLVSGYLDLAEKRARQPHPIYRLLREYWTFPAPTEETNK